MAAPASLFGKAARRPPGDPDLRARDLRLEALKTVIGKLAHDFNNFLVPQFGYLTLVSEELPAESSAAQYLKTMENAARTTEGYIESIMLAVRPQRQYAPKDFDLGALIAETLEHWRTELPVGTDLQVEAAIEPAPFHGDERHWRKVIEHLLSNARYALATGGTLAVELRSVELGGEEMQRLGLDSNELYRLVVRDSGFGMPGEHLEHAFEPFFTTRPLTRGSGLGLTIVHTVTHFHGGQVELRSAEDRGTTVTLWIPRRAPASAQSAITGLLRQKPARKKKALLIEDDPLIKEVLRGWLVSYDFDVQHAPGLEQASKLFERDPASWSLVISEARFREGTELPIPEIARGFEPTPCIFLAGKNIAVPESSSGGPLIIRKPVSLRAFSEVVLKYSRG